MDWPHQDFDLLPNSPARTSATRLGAPIDPPNLPAGIVPDDGAYQSGLPDWAYVFSSTLFLSPSFLSLHTHSLPLLLIQSHIFFITRLPGAYIRVSDVAALTLSCSIAVADLFSCSILNKERVEKGGTREREREREKMEGREEGGRGVGHSLTFLPAVRGLPEGRKLPPSFGLGTGPNPTSYGLCKTVFNYDSTDYGYGNCPSIPVGGQTRVCILSSFPSLIFHSIFPPSYPSGFLLFICYLLIF